MVSYIKLIEQYGAAQIAEHLVIPPRAGCHADWPQWVPTQLRTALIAEGVEKLWTHQVLFGELLQMGQHTALATGTGSGKSLAVWVPILAQMMQQNHENTSLQQIARRPTTLYLAPTKALGKDQENALQNIVQSVREHHDGKVNLPLLATIDGDADSQLRAWARDYADVIFSNPDFLHFAILPNHEKWARFFRSLSTIVIDEFHHYRGNFGANVALILRRLMRIAYYYGASPKVVFLSATSPDPEAVAQRFLGSAFGPVFAVSDDGSPRGQRDIYTLRCRQIPQVQETEAVLPSQWEQGFSEPILHDAKPDQVKRRDAIVEAGELTAVLVAAGAQTLTFVRSRAAAERVAEMAQSFLGENAPHLVGSVGAYRGGYLPEERRALEMGLRSGDIRALATTSALELGIDISGLDAVIVTGWPGTMASFQQQIGRTGRAGAAGVAVFIGRDDPLDQYLLDHSQLLAQTPTEMNVFDPNNPWILPSHLCAAAAELPLSETDLVVFGLADQKLFTQLTSQELLKSRPQGWYWNMSLKVRAHDLVDLRSQSHTISIIDGESGALLGTVSQAQADTTVYPGAIYVHQGQPFKVDALDGEIAVVHQHREEEIRTYARKRTSVRIEQVAIAREFSLGTLCTGSVRVETQVIGYDVRRTRDGMYLGYVPLDLPIREFTTSGTWFTVNENALFAQGLPAANLPGALHAAEHAMIGLLPLFAACDRSDLGGLSTALHPDTNAPTVIIHDSLAGGSGCALRGFAICEEWVAATIELLQNCPCKYGCPRCVQSPKCGNNNEPLSKSGAQQVLEILLPEFSQL